MTPIKRGLLFLLLLFASVPIYYSFPVPGDITLQNAIQLGILILLFLLTQLISYLYSRRLNNILIRQCDPVRYVKKLRVMLAAHFVRGRFLLITKLNLCAGLRAAGLFEEAAGILNSVPEAPKAAMPRAFYLLSLLAQQINDNSFWVARNTLSQIDGIKERLPRRWQDELEAMRYLLAIHEGNYEGAESFFLTRFETTPYPLQRVSAQFTLGRIHLHNGDAEKARSAFSYVTTHGNTLHLVILAQKELSALADLPHA